MKSKTKKQSKIKKSKNKIQLKSAYFSAGCFWSVEEKLNQLKGVINTEVGYMGGKTLNPTYKQVVTGKTGHAETVKVIYNPKQISYLKLIHYFFSIHDPTSYHKQGLNRGSQYRSILFYSNQKEKEQSFKLLNSLKKFGYLTELKKKSKFTKAETYHQKYLSKKNKILTENIEIFQKICVNNTRSAEKKYKGKYSQKEYLSGNRQGIYICPYCKNKLYTSDHIYDSKTGWPAFWDTIDGYQNSLNIYFNPETKELKCMKCGIHLGHRILDGPKKNKIHDCINSACIHFVEKKEK
mgnify:CR=1 FL=1